MTGDQLQHQFEQAFGSPPDLIVRSPGRVNMIGEHTDYNAGWALPAALDMGTDVVVRRQTHGLLRVLAPRLAAMRARARGYILKGADPDEIIRAVTAVAAGEGHLRCGFGRGHGHFLPKRLPQPGARRGRSPRNLMAGRGPSGRCRSAIMACATS
jgi:galactokinase